MPLLVNGRPLKSLNQGYNKRRAKMPAELPEHTPPSRALDFLTDHRTRSINYFLHVASRAIIDLLVKEGIGILVIGKNVGWKQEVNLGAQTNQSFVMIPHARFISMLEYQAELVGIQVMLIEASHTSKCSFVDLEPIGHHEQYVGKRVKRGLFRSAQGILLNADVNGAYHILRRYAPEAFADSISHCLLRPSFLRLPDRHQDKSMQRVRRKASA